MKIMENCVGCGQCVTFCPVHAISVCGVALIDETCTRCETCIRYCPVRAIRGDEP